MIKNLSASHQNVYIDWYCLPTKHLLALKAPSPRKKKGHVYGTAGCGGIELNHHFLRLYLSSVCQQASFLSDTLKLVFSSRRITNRRRLSKSSTFHGYNQQVEVIDYRSNEPLICPYSSDPDPNFQSLMKVLLYHLVFYKAKGSLDLKEPIKGLVL